MHKIKIIEKSDTEPFNSMPLSYRVTIGTNIGDSKRTITITRQFFRAGFHDGEDYGKFFFNMNRWDSKEGITRASFLSKKVKDTEYLKRKEEELIKIFVEKCAISAEIVDTKLKKETIRLIRRKNDYIATINELDQYFRSEKIQKIKNNIEND